MQWNFKGIQRADKQSENGMEHNESTKRAKTMEFLFIFRLYNRILMKIIQTKSTKQFGRPFEWIKSGESEREEDWVENVECINKWIKTFCVKSERKVFSSFKFEHSDLWCDVTSTTANDDSHCNVFLMANGANHHLDIALRWHLIAFFSVKMLYIYICMQARYFGVRLTSTCAWV